MVAKKEPWIKDGVFVYHDGRWWFKDIKAITTTIRCPVCRESLRDSWDCFESEGFINHKNSYLLLIHKPCKTKLVLA